MGHAHEHVEVISHDEREVRACEPEGVASIRAEGQGEREAVVHVCLALGPVGLCRGEVPASSARFKCPLQSGFGIGFGIGFGCTLCCRIPPFLELKTVCQTCDTRQRGGKIARGYKGGPLGA